MYAHVQCRKHFFTMWNSISCFDKFKYFPFDVSCYVIVKVGSHINFFRKYRTIKDYKRLYGTIQGYRGIYRTIGIYRTRHDSTGQYRSIQNFTGLNMNI